MKTEEIKGIEISSYSDGLGFALTNPTHTSPRGFEWKRNWSPSQTAIRQMLKNGVVYNGKVYKDVEEVYQKNKHNTPIGPKRNQFMLNIIMNKLKQYPILRKQIKEKGGVKFLEKCTHTPTKSKSYWETGGENMFIILLTEAYRRIINRE